MLDWWKISPEVYNRIRNFKPTRVKEEKTKIVLTDEKILQLYSAELTGKQKEMWDVLWNGVTLFWYVQSK